MKSTLPPNLVPIVGSSIAIASISGSPQPSPWLGSTNACAACVGAEPPRERGAGVSARGCEEMRRCREGRDKDGIRMGLLHPVELHGVQRLVIHTLCVCDTRASSPAYDTLIVY